MNEIDPILLLEYHKELNERNKFGSSVKGAVKGAVGGAVRGLLGPVVGAVGGAVSGARNAAHSYDQDHQKRSKAAKKGWKTRKSHGRAPMKSTREGIDPILWAMYNEELNEGPKWNKFKNIAKRTAQGAAGGALGGAAGAAAVAGAFGGLPAAAGGALGGAAIGGIQGAVIGALHGHAQNKAGSKTRSTASRKAAVTKKVNQAKTSGQEHQKRSDAAKQGWKNRKAHGRMPMKSTREGIDQVLFDMYNKELNEDTMMLNVGSEPVQGFGFEQKIDVKEKSDGTFSIIVQEDGQEIEVDTAQTGDEAKELAREYEKMFSSGPFLEEPNFSK